jgi:hypothetical protein
VLGGQGRIKASQQPCLLLSFAFLSCVIFSLLFNFFSLWDLWMVKENEQEFQIWQAGSAFWSMITPWLSLKYNQG